MTCKTAFSQKLFSRKGEKDEDEKKRKQMKKRNPNDFKFCCSQMISRLPTLGTLPKLWSGSG